jgi:hypothetical protein
MTGKVDQASLQSALYKTGYFVFLVVLVVAVLLSMRVALLQRNLVKQSHLTVSPPGVRTLLDRKMAPPSDTLSRPAHSIRYARNVRGYWRQHVHVHVELAVWLGHCFCAHGAFARVHHCVYLHTRSAFPSEDMQGDGPTSW